MTVGALVQRLKELNEDAIVVVSMINPNSVWNEAALVTEGTLPSSGDPMVMIMG